MPVLPLVASISVSPGLMRPRSSAFLTIDSARRVVALQLAEDHIVAAANFFVRQADELHERRVADRVFNCLVSHELCVISDARESPDCKPRRIDTPPIPIPHRAGASTQKARGAYRGNQSSERRLKEANLLRG